MNDRETREFDLIVIGAGSAGFSASITAADAGKRVALFGYGTIGGTCVNVGCVPSKTMIRAAEAVHHAKTAKRFSGLRGDAGVENWADLVGAKDDLVENMRQKKYADLLPQYDGVTYFDKGQARLVEGGVEVGGIVYSAPRIIIATGSRPTLPAIEGIDKVDALDSTGLLALQSRPDSLIFMGGGYVGVELAQMAARLGVRVCIVCRSRLLPGAEPEISEALTRALEDEGIKVHAGLTYKNCQMDGAGVVLHVEREGRKEKITAQRLVVTTGRRANSDALGLETVGVKINKKGSVIVGDDMQTSKRGVYAAGDVTDRDQFVYMAAFGAKLAAKNAVLDEDNKYSNFAMPWVVFSDPQVAGVGLSEAQAHSAGYDVKTSIVPLDQVPRALAARDTRGLIKLVADKKTDVLLGGQIMAAEGADSIQTLVMALKFSMTVKDLGQTIFPYLTTVEGLKLAAQTFDMDVARLSCCAG